MKIRLFTILACAGFALASCSSNDNDGPGPGDRKTKSAFIKLNTRNIGPYSDEGSATGTRASLYTALIYFLDNATDPTIQAVRSVAASGADYTLSELTNGVVIDGIPTAATQVYIVGNYNSSDESGSFPTFPTTVGQRLSDIRDVVLDIQQVSYQRIGTGTPLTSGLITVMDGMDDLVEYSGNETGWTGAGTPSDGDFYVVVTISPIVARLEVEEITYTGAFNSFTLEGIYINNYFARLPLSLDYTGRAVTDNGSTASNYSPTTAYANYSTMYDLLDSDFTGPATIEPTNGVWAYQVFSGTDEIPHIILKLTDVVDGNGIALPDQYLTVTGFLDGGSPVTSFARNTIYKIETLSFNDDNLTLVPEPETVNVYVQVTVEPWITVIVTPIV